MSLPADFQAAVLPKSGARHTVASRSLAPLKPGEVAIKITATAINPIDWKLMVWDFWLKEYPAVLGSDAAGEVVAVAGDVETLKKGDRVFFQGIIGNYDSATFQQYCKMPASLVAKTPNHITEDDAAGISVAMVAGLTAFYDQTGFGLRPLPWEQNGDKAGEGRAVVIIGGSSSVGQYAIQLARLSGFSKIITNSSSTHHDNLLSLGATTVLDRSKQSAPEHFSAALGETPLAFVFDTISLTETYMNAVKIVQAASHVETALVVRTDMGEIDQAVQEQSKKEPVTTFKEIVGVGSAPNLRYLIEPAMKHLGGDDGLVARGLVKPNSVTLVKGGLANISEALERNKQGVSGTKIVIRPFESSTGGK